MDIEIIETGTALDYPGAAISPASRVAGLVYTAGIIGIDPAGGALVGADIREQAEQALANARSVLGAAGCDLADVVMVQVFLADITRDLAVFNGIYARWFPVHQPPRYAIGATLAWPELAVELHMVAAGRDNPHVGNP